MSIQEQLDVDYKSALKSKDSAKVACIRQLKSKIQEAVNAKGFKGDVDDALYQKTITSYCKCLEKAIVEMQGGGGRSGEIKEGYEKEIAYLSQFLPKMLSEEETKPLVEAAIAAAGATEAKQMGQVMGMLMKDHKGKIDPAVARKLIEAHLS